MSLDNKVLLLEMDVARLQFFLLSSIVLCPTNYGIVTNETVSFHFEYSNLAIQFFQRQIAISVTNLNCQHEPDVCLQPYCRLKALGRGSTMLTFGCLLAHPINDVMVIADNKKIFKFPHVFLLISG
jgi:hypothetical protein